MRPTLFPPFPALDAPGMPRISKETPEFHYGKHHQTYITNLNNLILRHRVREPLARRHRRRSSGGIFNNAAQAWNHTFYWNSLSPNGGGEPSGKLADAIKAGGARSTPSSEALPTSRPPATSARAGPGWSRRPTARSTSSQHQQRRHPADDGRQAAADL